MRNYTHKTLLLTVLFAVVTVMNAQAQLAPKIVPGTTEAMQHAEFWISRIGNPDRIILTSSEIDDLNRTNRSRSFETTDINGDPYSFREVVENKDIIGVQFYVLNPLDMETFPGDSLRARFKRVNDYLYGRSYWDKRQLEFTDEMKRELIDKTNAAVIPDTIVPVYGVVVKHTLNRVFPTEYPGWSSEGGRADYFQSASLDMNTPVAILHKTANNVWYYVRSETAFGWVPAENIAIASKREIERALNFKHFLVSTGHKTPVYADTEAKKFIVDFYLGETLRLEKKTADGWRVRVPYRKPDGSLSYTDGWIGPDARVNVGWQEFTQRNVLDTFFSLLYRPYAWADNYNERDCTGTVRSVYRTFGLFLPRWTTHQLHCTNNVRCFARNTDEELKHGILDKCEPAVTLVGHAGHISMYIGKADGKYYAIHQSGYNYEGEDGKRIWVQRVNVNDTLFPGGSNVRTWTEIGEFGR